MTNQNQDFESALSSIKVTTNAKGQKQVEVKVYVDGGQVDSIDTAAQLVPQILDQVEKGIVERGGELAGA